MHSLLFFLVIILNVKTFKFYKNTFTHNTKYLKANIRNFIYVKKTLQHISNIKLKINGYNDVY